MGAGWEVVGALGSMVSTHCFGYACFGDPRLEQLPRIRAMILQEPHKIAVSCDLRQGFRGPVILRLFPS